MFVDDTTLTASAKSISEAEVVLNVDLGNIKEWLSANKLSLNLVKTEHLLIRSRYNINSLLEEPQIFVGSHHQGEGHGSTWSSYR